MRLNAGLPPNRWDEFVMTAAYLRNRVPTKSLKRVTPFQAYSGTKPNVSHLWEISSCAFVLILNKHNPKVFQCSEECVLIGYSKDSKSYRVYHRASHKVFESFHVVFIESKDDSERTFRPGVTQGLGDDDSQIESTTGPVTPSLVPSTSKSSSTISSSAVAVPPSEPPVTISTVSNEPPQMSVLPIPSVQPIHPPVAPVPPVQTF